MENNKFLRIIWSINGVIFLVFFLVVIVMVIIEIIPRNYAPESSVIVGEELEKAKKDGLILQGASVSNPLEIIGGEGYVLPVSAKTFSKPRTEDGLSALADKRTTYRVIPHYEKTINLIFTDKNLQATHRLLDRKAFIDDYHVPGEDFYDNIPDDRKKRDTVNYITYSIAFEDTDKNGEIGDGDNLDLYISDLEGKNLTQITRNIDVRNREFISAHELLITYKKRDDIPDEYKRLYFARYKIKEKKLEELTSIDKELDEIDAILTK